MKKRIAVVMIIACVLSLFSPAFPVYAGSDSADIEAQIAEAENELEEAKAAKAANDEKIEKGTLGFVEYMLNKSDLTDNQRRDLNSAKTILNEAIAESFTDWWGGDNTGLPESRNGKVTVIGDRYDAISLDNYEAMFVYLRSVNEIRDTDDLYVDTMKRKAAKTNFYITAIAQTGADRAAGLKRHSSLKTSCENLAFGQPPAIWLSEKGNFKKAMESLGIKKLISEENIKAIEAEAESGGYEIGHYTNLFWAVDQVMGIGFTNYGGTVCYNATKESNYTNKYAVYTIDEFEALFNEYYDTINPELFEKRIEEKQEILNKLYESYYSACSEHSFNDVAADADCTADGYRGRKCSKCGYVIKDEIIPATGHNFEDGICSRCGKKTVKEITEVGLSYTVGGSTYINTTSEQLYEVGKELSFYIQYKTESDYIFGDEFVVDILDPSVVQYTPESNDKGKMTMLKPGITKVKIYAKDNPAVFQEIFIDVADKGGHNYVISPADNDENTTIATCSKCGRVVDITVPTIEKVYYSKDNSSYFQSDYFRFDADSIGYVRVYLNGCKYFGSHQIVGNNDIVFEIEDESVMKFTETNGSSIVTGTFDILKRGSTNITIYPKYNPTKKRVYKAVVLGSTDSLVTEIKLDKTVAVLDLSDDKTVKLSADVSPSNAMIKELRWTSSNEKVATVDSNGNVTAVGNGTAVIRAYAIDGSGVSSDFCRVTVWGAQAAPSVSKADFSISEKKIISNLEGDYEYRILKDGEWSGWSLSGIYTGLSTNTEYKIGVRLIKQSASYLKEGEEKVVTIKTNDHTPMAIVGKEATCTEDGFSDGSICEICGEVIEPQETIEALGHEWDEGIVSVEADCENDGEIVYTCNRCNEVKKEVIAKTGHKLEFREEIQASDEKSGMKAHWECVNCGSLYLDKQAIKKVTKEELKTDVEKHILIKHDAKAATCVTDGNIAFWECEECGKLFKDSSAKHIISMSDTVIAAKGHDLMHVNAVEPSVGEDGNIEYWLCYRCGLYYSDMNCTHEITEEETVIPALPDDSEESEEYDISDCDVKYTKVSAWTGSAIKPVVTVKDESHILVKGKDYTVVYANNVKPGTGSIIITGIGDYAGRLTCTFSIKQANLKYRAYVQKKGWMSWSKAPVGQNTNQANYAGTTDNLRMETIQMQLSGTGGYVRYRAYCAKKGWTQWATTADTRTYAGTKGESRRVEMIQLQAKGQVAELYDMYYRTYCENFGWLGWADNNAKSGSAGYARKLEAFQIQFVPKGTYFDKGERKAFYDKSKDGADPK